MPAVARTREQPRHRGEATRDRGADDRGLPADRERVGEDRHDRQQVSGDPAEADDVGEAEDAEADQDDVLPGDGQQVIEPGGLECVPQVRVDALVGAEDDPEDE